MKVLVTYMSRTGNTKKVAETIFREIKGEKEIKTMSEVKSLDGYDLSFIGFPIEAYGPNNDAKIFLDQHSKKKNIALFITHAATEDSPDLPGWLDNCKAAAAGAKLVSIFDCQGELSEQVADFMLKSNDEKLIAWAKDRPLTIGQPDAARLNRARLWAREVLAKRR